jgi:hypothetical protein
MEREIALREAEKAVCSACAAGVPLNSSGMSHLRKPVRDRDDVWDCQAWPIRRLRGGPDAER